MNDIKDKIAGDNNACRRIVNEMLEYDIGDLLLMLNMTENDAEKILKSIVCSKDFQDFHEQINQLNVILWHIWALKTIIDYKKDIQEDNQDSMTFQDFLELIDNFDSFSDFAEYIFNSAGHS